MEYIRYMVLDICNQSLLMYRTMMIKAELKRRKAIADTQGRLYDQNVECSKESHTMSKANVSSISGTTSMYSCDRSEMKRVFDLFDENKDGLICAKELQLFMKRLGFEWSDEKVKGMVGTVDSNGDDCVDFEEFLSLYSSLCGGRGDLITAEDSNIHPGLGARESDDDVEGTLLKAFFVFDENKDGLISALELQQVLLKLGLPEGKSLMGCQKMIERVDADGNGKVDFFEFKDMMCSNALSICSFRS